MQVYVILHGYRVVSQPHSDRSQALLWTLTSSGTTVIGLQMTVPVKDRIMYLRIFGLFHTGTAVAMDMVE